MSDIMFDAALGHCRFLGKPGLAWEQLDRNGLSVLVYRIDRLQIVGVFTIVPDGAFTVAVDPAYRRRGIATALLYEAVAKFKIDFNNQNYTAEGRRLVDAFFRSRNGN
jgi:GNAT superfamily N-acetyltransferase